MISLRRAVSSSADSKAALKAQYRGTMAAMNGPTLSEVRDAAMQLAAYVRVTPTLDWQAGGLTAFLGPDTQVNRKLEMLQETGTLKLGVPWRCC